MKRFVNISPLIIICFVLIVFNGCKEDDDNNKTNTTPAKTVKDIDGNTYHYVKIGTQTWFVENLKVANYRNGEAILKVNYNSGWGNLYSGAYCDYNINSANSVTYGRLYNNYAVVDSRGICPTGWHVPSINDYTKLISYLGGDTAFVGLDTIAGCKMKETGLIHWLEPNSGAENSSGFTALPGGLRQYDGTFKYMGEKGYWWSSTIYDNLYARYISLSYNSKGALIDYDSKALGMSVRCLKD